MEFGLEILGKSDMRLIGGWASVEIVDFEKDYVPVNELANAMVAYMKNKGGQIFYEHQNKSVGKVIYWDIRKHPTTEKMGIYIIACLDKGYEFDDAIWNNVKEGELKGFSISGFAKSEEQIIKSEDGKEEKVRVLKNIEMMEISLVHKPANQYALIDEYNMFAKGVRTNDIPDMIKDLIAEVSEKVDAVTLQKIVDIIATYNKNNNGVGTQDVEVEEVIMPVSKSVKDTDDLKRILVGVLDEAKKVKGFVEHHTESGAYKGMADNIVKTIQALIDEVSEGIITVNSEKDKSECMEEFETSDEEESETFNDEENESVNKEEGTITSETEGYVNRVSSELNERKRKKRSCIVKHYVRIGELMSKVEKMLK